MLNNTRIIRPNLKEKCRDIWILQPISKIFKSATFHLTDWRLSHPKRLPDDLPVPLECHASTLNTIELQFSDTCMLQRSALIRIMFINAHFVADNASHALASSATVKPTFNDEEEVVVIRNGWTPMKEEVEHIKFYETQNFA